MVCADMKLKASKLIDARHKKGLKQQEVANGAAVSLMTVSNAENGKELQPGTAKKLCVFLDLVNENGEIDSGVLVPAEDKNTSKERNDAA
jgi:transcriptional regulator with XRE-family HTH domain